MRRILTIVLLAASLATPAGAQPNTGWTRHQGPGFSVELPASWADASRDRAKLLAEVQRLYADDAEVAAIIDRMLAAGHANVAVKLIAFDLAPSSLRTGFSTNLNVVRERTVQPLAAWRDAALKQLASSSFVDQPIWSQPVKLTPGKAVRFRYQAHFVVRGNPFEAAITQYAIVKNGSVYILTYTTLPKLEARYRSDFERSARSLRLP